MRSRFVEAGLLERRILSRGCSTELPGSVSEHHQARERTKTDEQKAEAIISARLKKLGWGKADLGARRKSDPQKVALANALRSETTMSLKWIARRLEMGSWTHVSNLLRQ